MTSSRDALKRRHDSQHNDIPNNETLSMNDTQHEWHSALMTLSINDTQHNNNLHSVALCLGSFCWVSRFIYFYAEWRNAECRYTEGRGAQISGTLKYEPF
jgi:hypothetical protein